MNCTHAGDGFSQNTFHQQRMSVAPDSGANFRPQNWDQKDEHQQWVLIFLAVFLCPENGPGTCDHFSA